MKHSLNYTIWIVKSCVIKVFKYLNAYNFIIPDISGKNHKKTHFDCRSTISDAHWNQPTLYHNHMFSLFLCWDIVCSFFLENLVCSYQAFENFLWSMHILLCLCIYSNSLNRYFFILCGKCFYGKLHTFAITQMFKSPIWRKLHTDEYKTSVPSNLTFPYIYKQYSVQL